METSVSSKGKMRFSEMTFMAKHIWEGIADFHIFAPWNESHPNVKGLTKLIGQGPFILKQCDLKNNS